MTLEQTETTVAIPLQVLKAIRVFTPKIDVRFYLTGIYVEVKEGLLTVVGTNGHILGWHEANTPMQDSSFWIANEIADLVVKTASTAEGAIFTREADGTFSTVIKCVGQKVPVKLPILDAKYPDYRRVIQASKINENQNNTHVYMRVGILSSLMKSAKMMGNSEPRILFTGEKSAAHVFLSDKYNVKALAMPCSI